MTTLSYFDPWTISYTETAINPTTRSDLLGAKVQKRVSHRGRLRASAERILVGAQVPYLEYFIREVVDGGKFTDYYADGSGVSQGEMRMVGGYEISAMPGYFVISCELEIYR